MPWGRSLRYPIIVGEAARAAFSWRTIDEELLALTHDSLELADAAVRGALDVRTLGFESDGLSLEIEVDGDRVFGQVLDADGRRGRRRVRRGRLATSPVDASGVFSVVVPGRAGAVRGEGRRRAAAHAVGRAGARISGLTVGRGGQDVGAGLGRRGPALRCAAIRGPGSRAARAAFWRGARSSGGDHAGDERRGERGAAPARQQMVEDADRRRCSGFPGTTYGPVREGVDKVASQGDDVDRRPSWRSPTRGRHGPGTRRRPPRGTRRARSRPGWSRCRRRRPGPGPGGRRYTSAHQSSKARAASSAGCGHPAERLIRWGWGLRPGPRRAVPPARLEDAAAGDQAGSTWKLRTCMGAGGRDRADHACDEGAVAGVLPQIAPCQSGDAVRIRLAGDIPAGQWTSSALVRPVRASRCR